MMDGCQRTAHPSTGRVAGGKSSAPERDQLLGMLQAAVQVQSQLLQADRSLFPKLAVKSGKDLEEVKGEHEDEKPGDDGNGVVMRTVFEMIVLGQFVEDVVLNGPPVVANAPDDLRGISVQLR